MKSERLGATFDGNGHFYITVSVYRAVDCRSTCVDFYSRSMGSGRGGFLLLKFGGFIVSFYQLTFTYVIN